MGTAMRWTLAIVLVAGFAPAVFAQSPLGFRKIFPTLPSNGSSFPIEVTVTNPGDALRGIVYIESGASSVSAPIELEKGATKKAVLYPSPGQPYEEVRLGIESDKLSLVTTLPMEPPTNQQKIVLAISDTPGILAFLPKARFAAATCSPEDAPNRAVGYSGASLVVLGMGSERLSDASVTAIRNYAAGGGGVVFVGGTNTPLVNDPRWVGIMPVGLGRSEAHQAGAAVASNLGFARGRSVSIVRAPLMTGSTAVVADDTPVIAIRPFGAGTSEFWAFDPFEASNRDWTKRVSLVSNAIERVQKNSVPQAKGFVREAQNFLGGTSSDAFTIQLPDAKLVIGGLALYGLVIVPLCLFGLNKLGRASWAWVALPLASIGFSLLIASAAQRVTKAEPGRSSQGTLALDSGSETGLFNGRQEVFFPKPGPRDLRLQGVELFSPQQRPEFGLPNRSPWRGLVLDVGEIIVPRLDLPPLSYREFELVQVVPRPGTLSVSLTGNKLTVKNLTRWSFLNGFIYAGDQRYPVGSLPAGETREVKGGPGLANANRVVFTANTLDAPIGASFLPESVTQGGPLVVWRVDLERKAP